MEGVFFVKSGPFLNAGCIMYSISIFFISHFTYLGEGCIRTPCLQACCKGGMGPWGSADKLYLDCQLTIGDIIQTCYVCSLLLMTSSGLTPRIPQTVHRYLDTIRVSIIYRTKPTTKKVENRKTSECIRFFTFSFFLFYALGI